MALYPNEVFCDKKIKNRKYSDTRPCPFKRGNRVDELIDKTKLHKSGSLSQS